MFTKMLSSFNALSEKYIDFKRGLDIENKLLLKEYNNENRIFLYSGANIHRLNSRFFENKDAKKL
ncbi:hypothetical protein Bmayo_04860 (plasmid) [Borreliella mayonii]|uniref:Uncharacterized protein n=1 Tax=Borreliella mayonii TaxID=1674146 RepID=A0AAC9KVN4_9SPIR|nr:hypothetical protein A7X70_05670 [Borreliella mayonii]APT00411.1 hypothetical protein Bmayo_04860 [Borreliella mayonii]